MHKLDVYRHYFIIEDYIGSIVFVLILAPTNVGMLCVHFVNTNEIIRPDIDSPYTLR